MNIPQRIREIIAEEVSVSVDAVKDDVLLKQELGAASLEIILVVVDIEDEFGVEIPEEIQENFKTPKDIIDYVEANVKK